MQKSRFTKINAKYARVDVEVQGPIHLSVGVNVSLDSGTESVKEILRDFRSVMEGVERNIAQLILQFQNEEISEPVLGHTYKTPNILGICEVECKVRVSKEYQDTQEIINRIRDDVNYVSVILKENLNQVGIF